MLILENADKEVSMVEFQQELNGLISTSQGAIFTCLQRMQDSGFVTVSKTAPMAVRAGKARNVYSITDKGRAALLEADEGRKALDVLRSRRPSVPQPSKPPPRSPKP